MSWPCPGQERAGLAGRRGRGRGRDTCRTRQTDVLVALRLHLRRRRHGAQRHGRDAGHTALRAGGRTGGRVSGRRAVPGGHGSHRQLNQRMVWPPADAVLSDSHVMHALPAQQPYPRPPPARQPSAELNTTSGASGWYAANSARPPAAMHVLEAAARAAVSSSNQGARIACATSNAQLSLAGCYMAQALSRAPPGPAGGTRRRRDGARDGLPRPLPRAAPARRPLRAS